MLDLPGQPLLDKAALVGGCLRLPLQVDARRLLEDVARLAESYWGSQGGRVGVHRPAEAVFLRGYAPAEGDRPIEDRPALAQLPYVGEIIRQLIPAPVQRCLLARLPAGEVVGMHVDRAPYFSKTVRIHVPVQTHELAWMFASGRVYRMAAGEVWALNNSAAHGVWNAHATQSRTHLICDFLPTPQLLDLLERGDRNCGSENPALEAQLQARIAGRSGAVQGRMA